jgi:hypothetical protein
MLPLLLLPFAGGAIVLPVSLAGSPPFTGLLDLSAATSILNWEAAALLGMTCTEQQQEQRQWQQQQQLQKDGSSSSSGGGGSKASESGGSSSSSGSAANMYGYFGNIEVLPDAELLLQRPKLPGGSSSSSSSGLLADGHHSQQQQQQRHEQGTGHDRSSSNSLGSGVQGQQQHLPKISLPGMPGSNPNSSSSSKGVWLNGNVQPFNIPQGAKGSNSSSRSSSSSSSSVGGFSPLRVQQHQAAASSVKLVLGHARLAAAATATNIGSSSSSSGSLLLSPPSRFGVAGLRGLAQLGLSGQPAMVVGADVWGRQRAVLCLKSGWLYLADRSPQVHQ